MSSPQLLHSELLQSPSIWGLYAKALTKGGSLRLGDELPKLSVNLSGVVIDPQHLSAYRDVCGFSSEGSTGSVMPATYLHMLAFPLHMFLLTDARFPAKLLGTVHVRNRIEVLALVSADDVLDIAVALGEQRTVASGIEFDIETRISSAGRDVWRSTSTMLYRCKTGLPKSQERKTVETLDNAATWNVPADIGRRYGAVSKDINPIHLSALSAKLFGFKRAIAHGMWTKAKALSVLEPVLEPVLQAELPEAVYAVEVEFKRPVFLPGQVQFSYRKDSSSDAKSSTTSNTKPKTLQFVLLDDKGEVPHLIGSVEKLA
ncbi:MAG: hypothetical protein K6L73_03195 [Cellvibrionaceae bacterium]